MRPLAHALGLIDALITIAAILAAVTGHLPATVGQGLAAAWTAFRVVLLIVAAVGAGLAVHLYHNQTAPPYHYQPD